MKSLLFAAILGLSATLQAQVVLAQNSCETILTGQRQLNYDVQLIKMKGFSRDFEKGSDADSVANQSIARTKGLMVIDAEDKDLEDVLGENAFYQATAYIDAYASGIKGESMSYLVTNPQSHVVGLVFQMVEFFGPGQPVAYSYIFFSVDKAGAKVASLKGPLVVDQVAELTNISDDPDSEKFSDQLKKIGAEVEDAEDYDLEDTLPWVYDQYADAVSEIRNSANGNAEEMNYLVRDDSGQIVGLIFQQTKVDGHQFEITRAFFSISGTLLRKRKQLSARN